MYTNTERKWNTEGLQRCGRAELNPPDVSEGMLCSNVRVKRAISIDIFDIIDTLFTV